MKKLFSLFALALLAQLIWAVDNSYYESLEGKSDSELRQALTELLYTKHTLFSKYDWDFPYDYDSKGNMLDIYSNCGFNSNREYTSDYKCCCDAINREHVVCQSNFGGDKSENKIPQYSDRHHLFPVDGRANGHRSDLPFGECSAGKHGSCKSASVVYPDEGTSTCENHEFGKSGTSTFSVALPSGGGKVYEVGDEYKGDIARAILYMVVRYADSQHCRLPDEAKYCTSSGGKSIASDHSLKIANSYPVTVWANTTEDKVGQMFSSSLLTNHGLSEYGKAILLKWHRQDAVSQKEISRNDGVEAVQGNRNPFIDHPELVEYLWGDKIGQAFSFDDDPTPTPTTKYAITWSVKGATSSDEVTEGDRPTAPSVNNCSESRVFMGWTTSSTVVSKPVVLYASNEIPTAYSDATYYAVFADKDGSGFSSDYEQYDGELTEGDYVIYYGGKAMKASVSNSRFDYTGVAPTNHTISNPDEDIVWHIAPSGDYWTIYNASVGKYAASTGGANKGQLVTSGSDDKALWTASGSETYEFVNKYNTAQKVNANLRNNVTYGFACYSSQTGGELSLYKSSESSVSYSLYGLNCTTIPDVNVTFYANDGTSSSTIQVMPQGVATKLLPNPFEREHFTFLGWATTAKGAKVYNDEATITTDVDLDLYAVWQEDPKYTVTFMNGNKVYDEITGYAGEEILVYDPTACDGYEFEGWSLNEYAADNTETPALTVPTEITNANKTYYAVYKHEELHDQLGNNYKKITSTSELTDANYLVVADTSNNGDLVAMTTTLKKTYYLEPSAKLTAENDIIITTGDTIIWQVTVVDDKMTLFNVAANGYFYIEKEIKNNKTYYNIKIGNNTTDNKFTYKVSNDAWVLTSASYTNRQLEYYKSPAYWTSFSAQDAPIYLYKQQSDIIKTTYHTTTFDCSGSATGIEDREVETVARKLLINGQLFILRDGKIYTIQGARVQ